MRKYFNIAGPCQPDKHYMLPAQERCNNLLDLIEQSQYFVIHAARQSGKTTLLLDLVKQLNDSGDYYALYCSLETVQQITEMEKGIPAIIRTLATAVEFNQALQGYTFADKADEADFNNVLQKSLVYFCQKLDKPLVILFDEADCLSNGTLISFLRQLRSGYVNRGQIPFVHSVALVGMRNIRDYKGKIREDRETLGSASPFNIVTESLTLRNFNQEEVGRLYAQHTAQTGQLFPPDVVAKAYDYTQGQPWLVNAIAREIVEKMLAKDFSRPILPEYVDQAVQTLILRRDTHLDSLMERLKEERVQKVIEPIILGEPRQYGLLDDNHRYVLDLGLLREADQKLVPANQIYAEVMIRTLNYSSQQELNDLENPPYAPAYLTAGKLDMRKLLADFQAFWREHSEAWIERYQYKEAAPHLILLAFLQRILNGGGAVTREMASGNGRLDLCVHYERVAYPIELKLRYSPKTSQEGQAQLAKYMDKLGCVEGWLIIFDRRKSVSWSKKIFWKNYTVGNKVIHVVGC